MSEYDEGEVWGDDPGEVPGTVDMGSGPRSESLHDRAKRFLERHPGIVENAQKGDKDIIAERTGKGKRIIIGAGVAGLVVTGVVVGVVLHERKQKNN